MQDKSAALQLCSLTPPAAEPAHLQLRCCLRRMPAQPSAPADLHVRHWSGSCRACGRLHQHSTGAVTGCAAAPPRRKAHVTILLGAMGMQLAAQAASKHIFPQGSTYHCCSLLADPGCSPLPESMPSGCPCCCFCMLSVSVHPCWLSLLVTSQVPVPFRRLPAVAVKNS